VIQIRDPIHGSVQVTPDEITFIDSPYFQRLRNVKQLGFGDLAFPGATHTRYSHSLGAMHISDRVLDSVLPAVCATAHEKKRMRQAVRLAVLHHDVGHAPLSHASEATMPPIRMLELPEWVLAPGESVDDQASHEHYTLAILLKTQVADNIHSTFGDLGLTPEAVASLVAGHPAPDNNPFVCAGIDYHPLLTQIVSSELDADRMDYLQRDSFYTGANYGRFDLDWIVENLTTATVENHAYLALHKRAIFAFEDFLMSRYHMFLSVYYHYSPICFDRMLRRYYAESRGEYVLPADPESYLEHDDAHLLAVLRKSESPWARAIVNRKPWKLLLEANPYDTAYDVQAIEGRLTEAGVESFVAKSKGILSKYFGRHDRPALYVVDPSIDRRVPIESYTPLYERFVQPVKIDRIYCDPAHVPQARSVVEDVLRQMRAAG
jgi:HD superfamily phosphohydrolase